MSKGLEALQRLFDHNYGNNFYIKAEEDAEIIEKELKEKETQDDYIQVLEDRIDNLETTYSRYKKALEIIRKKHITKYAIDTLEQDWNLIEVKGKDITQEEYDLLKEVLR